MAALVSLALYVSLGASLGPSVLASPPPRLTAQLADVADESVDEPADDAPSAALGDAIRERERLRPWHIVFGNLTWAATNITTLLGFLHFNDLYGWSGDPADSGCASGAPVLGADLCSGTPWPHAIAAGVLTVSYGASLSIALFMPDPLSAGEGDGEHATVLRAHRTLRWVLLGLIVAQATLGGVISNVDFGPGDADTQRGLAVTHLALGSTTWAAMTAMAVLGSVLAF